MPRNNRNFKKSTILKAIKGSNGIISNIAKMLDCEWHVAERNINRFDETKRVFQDEKEKLLDFAEGKAIQAMNNGDGAMIRYYLSTIGKKRGYTENGEATAQGNANTKIELVLIDKPLDGKK